MAIVAIFFIYLGSLNATLSVGSGTCTQGDAAQLYGGVLTLAFYLVGGIILSLRSLRIWHIVALVPACIVALWHSVFAVRFAWGYFVNGISACDALTGDFAPNGHGYEMDEGEALFSVVWLSLSILFWVAIIVSSLRARHQTIRNVG